MRVIVLLAIIQVAFGACPSGQVEYWVTDPNDHYTNDNAGQRQGCLSPSKKSSDIESRAAVIDIDSNQRYQTMDGFGAAMTNSAAYLIQNSRHRDELLQALFGSDGIGINYIRLPMGASDFMGRGYAYTYDDTYDPSLEQFSIAEDEEYVIPTLLAAKDINPNLKIVASPWSAPAWMKTSNSLDGGSFISDYIDVYGNYWVKFLQAYKDHGIEIDTLTLQNEPLAENPYPTMLMSSSQQAELAKNLGPKLRSAGLNTKILILDHNWDLVYYVLEVLGDADARQYIDGVAWHCYGGDYTAPSQVHQAYPDINTYFTECTGTTSDTTWPRVFRWNLYNLHVGQTRNWAKNVLLWNLVLDENYGPMYEGSGGCKICRGIITLFSDDSHWERSIEYHAIGHMTKASQQGSVRIESTSGVGINNDVFSVAFDNPDGTIGVVIGNNNWENEQPIEVHLKGQTLQFTIPKEGAVTFRN